MAPFWCHSPTGLSPRVRGNPGPAGGDGGAHRSIPACAGEPGIRPWESAHDRVYPRVCGGTAYTWYGGNELGGLSPRVRGNLKREANDMAAGRSIPACAGEPPSPTACPAAGPVYPRVCGGTRRASSSRRARKGLSPRVRGNPHAGAAAIRTKRSIPACAGEPSGQWRGQSRIPVYPRVCGGTSFSWASIIAIGGLSPRVRGNPESGDDGAV